MPNKQSDKFNVELGARLRAIRLMRGMSQMDLAKDIGVTFQQVQKYEKGLNRISASLLRELSSIFDVSLSYFLDDTGFEISRQEVTKDTLILRLYAYFQLIEKPHHRKLVCDIAKALSSHSEE